MKLVNLITACMFLLPASAIATCDESACINHGSLDSETPDEPTSQVGYRGFAELGYTASVGDYAMNRIELSTTHGYQVTNYLYVGAGVCVNYFTSVRRATLPVYGDIRADILRSGLISYYIDAKIGYTLIELNGLYLHPSIGLRYDLGENVGINLGLGYTLINFQSWFERVNVSGIGLKVGLDF